MLLISKKYLNCFSKFLMHFHNIINFTRYSVNTEHVYIKFTFLFLSLKIVSFLVSFSTIIFLRKYINSFNAIYDTVTRNCIIHLSLSYDKTNSVAISICHSTHKRNKKIPTKIHTDR